LKKASESTAARQAKLEGITYGELSRLASKIQSDVDTNEYDGAAVLVARHGKIGLHTAIGFADRAKKRICIVDDVFNILSVTKAFADVLILSLIEQGKLSLTTPVVKIIPEIKGGQRDNITVFNLLTHTAGSPQVMFPVEAKLMGNLEAVLQAICQLDLIAVPGAVVCYSPLWGHALLGTIVQRLDERKRSLRDIYHEDLFSPLGMQDTALGRRKDLKPRIVPIVAHDASFGNISDKEVEEHNQYITEKAEIPWMGGVSTVYDLYRFAEMLRRGGELDGVRILSPASVQQATSIQTGTLVNQYYAPVMEEHGVKPPPANVGLDFQIRGTGFWVDPERDVTFVFLRSGLLEHMNDAIHYQQISDMAMAAMI